MPKLYVIIPFATQLMAYEASTITLLICSWRTGSLPRSVPHSEPHPCLLTIEVSSSLCQGSGAHCIACRTFSLQHSHLKMWWVLPSCSQVSKSLSEKESRAAAEGSGRAPQSYFSFQSKQLNCHLFVPWGFLLTTHKKKKIDTINKCAKHHIKLPIKTDSR